jgi:hypothetical protein
VFGLWITRYPRAIELIGWRDGRVLPSLEDDGSSGERGDDSSRKERPDLTA